MRRQLTALVLVTVFAIGLTGCSGPSGLTDGPEFGTGGSQTVAEACASFSAAMTDGQAELSAALRDAGTNPAKTAEAFEILDRGLSDAFESISNSEVSELGDAILENLTAMADIATDVIGNGNTARTAELSEASNAFALSMQDLQALCA
ncbi:MAG TPA: hypothetical protein PLA13_05920 [Microbacteriaceae bacterium]|jgi:hypothetical protein|nr:hypothetical protein [Microbacteriaceae bacterium]HQX35875.1 hypothetical protein [Microbacteriaceae bacterium]HQZ48700.1 hypothetical protein [Microbacteriaceae bacterium]HRA08535.1 hypothetical protein [Microbacteriaceae bacterium]